MLKISKFLDGLRRSDRAKQVDMDFFSNLSVGEGKADDEGLSQVTAVPSTLASGSMSNPRPRGSSPSKTMGRTWLCLRDRWRRCRAPSRGFWNFRFF